MRAFANSTTLQGRYSAAEDALSPLFEAAGEATEEAIDNSLLKAHTVRGMNGHTAPAIPIARLREILAEARVAKQCELICF